jgi:hypothetical protein
VLDWSGHLGGGSCAVGVADAARLLCVIAFGLSLQQLLLHVMLCGSRERFLDNFPVLSLHTGAAHLHSSIQMQKGVLQRKSQRGEARQLTEPSELSSPF